MEMKEITVRSGTMNDYETICRLTEQVDRHHVEILPDIFQPFSGPVRSRERVAHFVEQDDAEILVADRHGDLIGYLNLEKAAHPSYPMFKQHEYVMIHNLVVDATHRGEGVGSLLLDAVKHWARDHGLHFIQTNVYSANVTAEHFYTKYGFHSLSTRIELDLDREKP